MLNFLKENWFKVIIILLIINSWYWYSYRPSEIRKKCNNGGFGIISLGNSNADYYTRCLRNHGLK